MGGLINAVSNLGGGSNQFKATAPKINFQAQKATLPTTNYGGTIAGATGNYDAATADQNALVHQLQTAAGGGGPNPALTQLQQTTAANVNNAAGAAASARGINPALAARMAVDNAATANQTAAGQAATLEAQQQIAARDQLASTLAAKAGTAVQALGTTGGLQNQQAGLELQNTLGTEGLDAGVATANAANDLAAQQINAGVAGQNAQIGSQLMGGLLQGGGAALAALAHGGEVPDGEPKKTDQELAREVWEKRHGKGDRKDATPNAGKGKKLSDKELAAQVTLQRYFKNAPKHAVGAVIGAGLEGLGQGFTGRPMPAAPRAAAPADGVPALLARPAEPGATPWAPVPVAAASAPAAAPRGPASAIGQLLSGVGGGLRRPASPAYARGGDVQPVFYSHGSPEVVPGRAAVPYGEDSTRGDRVPAMLTPGEGVLPRSVMQAPDAPEKARSFVAHLVKARGASGYARVAAAKKKLKARA